VSRNRDTPKPLLLCPTRATVRSCIDTLQDPVLFFTETHVAKHLHIKDSNGNSRRELENVAPNKKTNSTKKF